MKKIALPLLAIGICVVACKSSKKETVSFLTASNMDTSINAADDFYRYANGGWLKTAKIDETESSAGGFTDLYNRTQVKVRSLIEDVANASNKEGSNEQKVGDFYKTAMDSSTIDKLGYKPLQPFLDEITKIKTPAEIITWIANRKKYSYDYLLETYVGADEKNSSTNILSIYQGGLGLPDRDYYFKSDAETKKVYDAYITNIKALFTLIGVDSVTASKNADIVYNLEKKLAMGHKTNIELRDPQANYNKLGLQTIETNYPNLHFGEYVKILNIKLDSFNVGQLGYLKQLNSLLASEPIENWKVYLSFHTIGFSANGLSQPFIDASFNYYKVLTGQKKQKPRWERMTGAVNTYLGDALGQIYVKKHFPAEAKQKMLDLVNNLQKAFETRITKLDWMSEATKTKAKEKLNTFLKKIGYPDTWKDYSSVTITPKSYFDNVLATRKFRHEFEYNKLGKPVDKTEWGMSAPTINAYYNPTFNEIVFPAGILQFPFFDLSADDAINYGGIGMVIGHEMTHGFDDQGAQYDKIGNMANWWNKEDEAKFKAKGKSVIDLYNSFKVLDTVAVQGALTLGENLADMGGIAIAYDAFKLTKQGQSTEKIDGFTADQRFFLSFAQIWQEKMKDESMRTQINTDPHSPPMFRVMGPLMHFEPFYKAFNVKAGNKMFVAEKDRIKIW
jgi:putative endopeptidase